MYMYVHEYDYNTKHVHPYLHCRVLFDMQTTLAIWPPASALIDDLWYFMNALLFEASGIFACQFCRRSPHPWGKRQKVASRRLSWHHQQLMGFGFRMVSGDADECLQVSSNMRMLTWQKHKHSAWGKTMSYAKTARVACRKCPALFSKQ